MYARVRTYPEMELVKWLALLAIAGALVIVLVSTAVGAELTRPPGLLPPELPASPMPLPSVNSDETNFAPGAVSAVELWKAIQLQKEGNVDEAIALWETARLPSETDHWRLLMLAIAYMENGDNHRAEQLLREADSMAPDNPVIDYALGLLWLSQADAADEWYDASSLDPFRLTSTSSQESTPRTRSMYQLAALMSFEQAVKLADKVDLDQSLLGEGLTLGENERSKQITTPRARDALEVFGGDRFEGRSHLALGLMYMQRGGLKHAEEHLDCAALRGEPTGSAFHDLGKKFEEENAASEAMRAHLKAFSRGGGIACLEDAFEQFGRAMTGE